MPKMLVLINFPQCIYQEQLQPDKKHVANPLITIFTFNYNIYSKLSSNGKFHG